MDIITWPDWPWPSPPLDPPAPPPAPGSWKPCTPARPSALERDRAWKVQPGVAARDGGRGGGVPRRPRRVDRDGAGPVGDVELARGIQGDGPGAVESGIAARDSGRGGGVPRRPRRVDRDAVCAVVGDVERGGPPGGRRRVRGREGARAGGRARV